MANPSVPDFDERSVICGAPRSAFVDSRHGVELKRKYKKQADVANQLFFNGGKLTQYGLRLKPEVDSSKAHRALRALLSSFEPSHEAKIGTVAKYLHEWCEECEPVTPEENRLKPKPEAKKAVARASLKWRKKR